MKKFVCILMTLFYCTFANGENMNKEDVLKIIEKYKDKQGIKFIENLVKQDINAIDDRYGFTALMYASGLGYTEIVQSLIAANADVNIIDKQKETALMVAVNSGYIEIVKALIDANADVNLLDDKRSSLLLHILTKEDNKNNQAIAKMLITAGINVNITNQEGYTALQIAKSRETIEGYQEIITMLIKAGAKEYMWSSDDTLDDIVHVLIKEGASAINQQDHNGYTVLMYMVAIGDINSVKKLLQAKANVHIKAHDGKTALSIAKLLESKNQEDEKEKFKEIIDLLQRTEAKE